MLGKATQKKYIKSNMHNWEQKKPNSRFDLSLNMLHISFTRQELYRHFIIKILAIAQNRQLKLL